jgi:hypothetical protein
MLFIVCTICFNVKTLNFFHAVYLYIFRKAVTVSRDYLLNLEGLCFVMKMQCIGYLETEYRSTYYLQ